MIAFYPAVLVLAGVVLARSRSRPGGRGWRWFWAWWAAGGVFAFSFVTGLSIGLFFLPFAAAVLLLVAGRAPHFSESIGFIAGVGTLALVVAWRSWDHGVDPAPWLVGGLTLTAVAVATFALSRSR